MSCRRCDRWLEALLDERLSAGDRRLAEAHVASCRRCREIWALAVGALRLPAVPPPPDLAASVLERTSGPPCRRAGGRLCDWVDGRTAGLDAELVRLHVEECPRCGPLAAALARLRADLRPLAELQPDAGFVADVLAATARAAGRRRPVAGTSGAPARWTARLGAAWRRSLQRPRFAFEFGYVGAVMLLLVFGTPGSPLSGAPARAMALVRPDVVAGLAGPAGPVGALRARVDRLRREAVARAPRASLDGVRRDLTARVERTSDARLALKLHGAELGDAAAHLDLERGSLALRQLRGDFGSILTRFLAGDAEAGDASGARTDTEQGRAQ